jgi:outer membrane murein-binding lipoprotein Lpp
MESTDTQKLQAALTRIEQKVDEVTRHVKALEAEPHK